MTDLWIILGIVILIFSVVVGATKGHDWLEDRLDAKEDRKTADRMRELNRKAELEKIMRDEGWIK